MDMNFTNTINYGECPVCDNPRRSIKDNLAELTDCIHLLDNKVDSLLRFIWSKEDSNPEKYIDIVDMDSSVVHDLDVVGRINEKMERIISGIGCY